MAGKILIGVSCLLVGAGAMFLITSGLPVVVEADCPGDPGRPCGNGDVNGDGKLNVADAVYLLNYLFLDGPAPAQIACSGGSLPATGQKTCFGEQGLVDCTGLYFPGQDGFYQAGCPVEGRFVDNGDGTVTDRCTGLMWEKETAPSFYDWESALMRCYYLTLAGYTDWRLPNINELQSIVDYGRYTPAIDPVFVVPSDTALKLYWSSTGEYSDQVWSVSYWLGQNGIDHKSQEFYVRAVRGGL